MYDHADRSDQGGEPVQYDPAALQRFAQKPAYKPEQVEYHGSRSPVDGESMIDGSKNSMV